MLEELATAAYAVGRLDDAFPAIERAIAIYRELGDAAAVGRCTRVLSRFHWFAGDGDAARAKALEAIAILEPLGESVELARAYSGLSQLAMLAEDAEQAFAWGERALELATRLGDERTRAHALVNIGSARLQLDHRRRRDAARGARGRRRRGRPARGDARARQPRLHADVLGAAGARRCATREQALAYAAASTRCTRSRRTSPTMVAWLRLRAGEWDEAERVARARDRAAASTVPAAARQDGADRAGRPPRRSGCRRAAGRPRGPGRSHGRAAADRAGRSSWRPSGR